MTENSKITKEEVLRLANLSRIKIDGSDLEMYASQLNEIVKYVSKLDEVELDDVEPLFHVLDKTISGRNDEVQPSFEIEELLKNAPDKFGDFFKVPPVIKGKKKSK